MCDEIFLMADQDGDGRLGYDDMVWLVKATNTPDAFLSAEDFDGFCEQVFAVDKLTKDQLFSLYQGDMWSIKEDWAKLKAAHMARMVCCWLLKSPTNEVCNRVRCIVSVDGNFLVTLGHLS